MEYSACEKAGYRYRATGFSELCDQVGKKRKAGDAFKTILEHQEDLKKVSTLLFDIDTRLI